MIVKQKSMNVSVSGDEWRSVVDGCGNRWWWRGQSVGNFGNLLVNVITKLEKKKNYGINIPYFVWLSN